MHLYLYPTLYPNLNPQLRLYLHPNQNLHPCLNQ
jgi:hypothetical protein